MVTVSPISVHIENVRSFAAAQDVLIRPLTLLVGENNSGKSTFLAVAACVFGNRPFAHPGFEDQPFNRGSFDTIATLKGGKPGGADSFAIGYDIGEEDAMLQSLTATYKSVRGQTWLARLEANTPELRLRLQFESEVLTGELHLSAKQGLEESINLRAEGETAMRIHSALAPGNCLMPLLVSLPRERRSDPVVLDRLFSHHDSFASPFAFVAPLRTTLCRTDDSIPRVLAQLLNGASDSPPASDLRETLKRFGEASGLFKDVMVKSLGKGASDLCQVQVNVGGTRVSLADAGDGVNQALSVLVQVTLRKENSLMLLQQPETYLHPRAQAELGTFLAEQTATGRGAMFIETHSDYIIDRVRYAAARRMLNPEQVQILYFERPRTQTDVYMIDVDAMGNVLNAPASYRSFFLEEEFQLFTRGKT